MIINILPEMFEDWSLHGYYARFKNISLDPDLTNMRYFLLIKGEQMADTSRIINYKKADIPTIGYQLYIRE
jgi:hypothetical protein